MNIMMTGGTGFIGQELGFKLVGSGHKLKIVTRDQESAKRKLNFSSEFIECDLNSEALKASDFADIDVIINLAGESVDGRWTAEKKKLIKESREQTTRHLLLNCPNTVKTIVTASAQGFYGDRGNEALNEDTPKGAGFLAEVCDAWEAPFRKKLNQRVVILRIGLVLSKKGGALKKMMSLFKNYLGAELGSGEQWMSFISLDDLTNLFCACVEDANWTGLVNAVNNKPVQNKYFTRVLVEALGVIQLPRVPKFMLKIVLGEMSELVLASLKVYSAKSEQNNFKCRDLDLAEFLKRELAD